jgi:hypothetical protein
MNICRQQHQPGMNVLSQKNQGDIQVEHLTDPSTAAKNQYDQCIAILHNKQRKTLMIS